MANLSGVNALLSRLTPRGALRSLGVFARNRIDWTLETSGYLIATQAAVAAQISYVALQNNDSAARNLVVYGYSFSAGSPATMRALYGALGSPNGTISPARFGAPTPPGAGVSGAAAALPGVNMGSPTPSGGPAGIFPNFPLAIVPPGWNFIIGGSATNTAITVTIMYGLY